MARSRIQNIVFTYFTKEDMKGLFNYKNKTYQLIDEIGYKNPVTREWEAVALYTDGKQMYTRDLSEFYSKFTEVPRAIQKVDYRSIINEIKRGI